MGLITASGSARVELLQEFTTIAGRTDLFLKSSGSLGFSDRGAGWRSLSM